MKHFKRPFAVFAAGMAVALTTMAFEAKSQVLSLDREAACYSLASASGQYDLAKKHRLNLIPYRESSNEEIIFQVGYTMGLLDGSAIYTKDTRTQIAAKMYETHCTEA